MSRTLWSTVLASLLLVPAVRGEEKPRQSPDVEKRLAELEKQLETMLKEVRALRQELKEPAVSTTIAVELKHANADDAAKVLQQIYREAKTTRITTIGGKKLLIYADEKDAAEIRTIINILDTPRK
jgi:hypothetical protein